MKPKVEAVDVRRLLKRVKRDIEELMKQKQETVEVGFCDP